MEANIKESKSFEITLGDNVHAVDIDDVHPETTLNEYLRDKLFLKGTKVMCREGGCGACIVVAEIKDPSSNVINTVAVNSCLVALYSCQGWKIKTVEGIGNSRDGFHPIQSTLANFHGSQCGFCSPGMVMNMYAQLENGSLTMKQVENAFGGNLCRCTGYRPILAAFKSMTVDASVEYIGEMPSTDIEEITKCMKKNGLNGTTCKKSCRTPCKPTKSLCYTVDGSRWYKVTTLPEIVVIFNILQLNETYMLVAGNTAKGVYKRRVPLNTYIDIGDVAVLKTHQLQTDSLVLGGNMTLATAMSLFYKTSEEQANFSYLATIADHIDLVASVPVRNIGTLAGNLMIKHAHNEFPSDIFLLLSTVGAKLTIMDRFYDRIDVRVIDFLTMDMKKKIIERITLPALDASYKLGTYKITPRAQNAHAYVNAGFLVKNTAQLESVRIIYGNIAPTFIRAAFTEDFLLNKNLFDNNVIQAALATLDTDLSPVVNPPEPSPEYRKALAKSLFYKFVLSIAPDSLLTEKHKSGAKKMERPISTGTQIYETNPGTYPISKPMRKIEAPVQTSGEAQYIYDLPDHPNQLYAAFVTAKAKAKSTFTSIDASAALALPGVVAFYKASDIPGENTFTTVSAANAVYSLPEQVFSTGEVKYYDQPIGLIVANSWKLAEDAAEEVVISYSYSTEKPLTTIKEVLASGDASRVVNQEVYVGNPRKDLKVTRTISGEVDINTQYHFHMETQCVQAVPLEDGIDLFASSQFTDYTQACVGNFLAVPYTTVNVVVRRLGGGFGAKLSRGNLLACAAALAATKLHRPVKILLPLETNMRMIGFRTPNHAVYELSVNDDGVVVNNDIKFYVDVGAEGGNENPSYFVSEMLMGTYHESSISVEANFVKSDIPTTAYARGPGSADGLGIMESIMERAAHVLNLNPFDFRFKNVDDMNVDLKRFMVDFREWAKLDARTDAVKLFNQTNRWMKKGICAVPMVFKFPILFYPFTAIVSLYQSDGSVAISHGGTEMGQGVNTKAVQVAAKELGVSTEKISIKPTNTVVGANNTLSGGSVTSEGVCYAVMDACRILKQRLAPFMIANATDITWVALLKLANLAGVNLTAHGIYSVASPNVGYYVINGIAAAEVQVDILTGQHLINRVDILEDVGSSMNPAIDVGQVEGGFVMGTGMYTSEKVVIDADGQVLTHNTWNYKVPGAKDIPVEFNVRFPLNPVNPTGVYNSKAVGEPPLCLSVCVPLAIRNAVASARLDSDPSADFWYTIDGPSSIDNTFMNSLHNAVQYIL